MKTAIKFTLLIMFLLIFIPIAKSQTLSKEIIGIAGTTYENEYNKLSYTAGELLVGAMTDENATYQLGNGYYPSLDLSTLSKETPELKLQVKLYPNPVTGMLFISHPTEQNFKVIISDINGKQILKTTHQKDHPLNVQSLAIGTYLVTITTGNLKQVNTYKIIKQ